jgi:hypothetical protein
MTGASIFHAMSAVSTIKAAMSEWRNDWTRYMPGHELKIAERFIMHGNDPDGQKRICPFAGS